jgi:hypothetical protein
MVKVISFDPGGTTGYTNSILSDGMLSVGASQAKWSVGELWDYLDAEEPDIIVYESFEYRNRARAGLDLTPVELIGVIKLYIEKVDNVTVRPQRPGTGFDYFTDKKLKEDGLYIPGKPHAMDAVRHLLHWYTFGPGYKYNTRGYDKRHTTE